MVLLFGLVADVLLSLGEGQTRARQPAMREAWKFTDEGSSFITDTENEP